MSLWYGRLYVCASTFRCCRICMRNCSHFFSRLWTRPSGGSGSIEATNDYVERLSGVGARLVARVPSPGYAHATPTQLFAPEVGVVHCGQVVVNQGVGVDQLQRTGDRHQSWRRLLHRFCRGNGQNLADSLPFRYKTVLHALMERGGAGHDEIEEPIHVSRFCSR